MILCLKKKLQEYNAGKMMKGKDCIFGAIAGDIIGSAYEFNNTKTKDFELFTNDSVFTDDSVLTIATMYALMSGGDYEGAYLKFARKYPQKGYGAGFKKWMESENPKPYNSFGNGSAMRVSPIGWFCDSIGEVLAEAEMSAEVTHNHAEGIKGAQAAAAAVFLARTGKNKKEIKRYIVNKFGYNLNRTLDQIRPTYVFDGTCQGSVPEAIIAFLESTSYESAVRLAVSLGGDSDTIAAIAGGIAEAFYMEIPEKISEVVRTLMTPDLMREVIIPFSAQYKKL